jgi:hypothetical protein
VNAGGKPEQEPDEPFSHLIDGLHDVRLPVSDPWVSRAWYMSVLAFEPMLDLQEEAGLVGVVLRHASGLVVGLHQDRVRAAGISGFVVLTLSVADRAALHACATRLDEMGQTHSDIEQGHVGWYLDVADPDGIVIRLHTATTVDAEEA